MVGLSLLHFVQSKFTTFCTIAVADLMGIMMTQTHSYWEFLSTNKFEGLGVNAAQTEHNRFTTTGTSKTLQFRWICDPGGVSFSDTLVYILMLENHRLFVKRGYGIWFIWFIGSSNFPSQQSASSQGNFLVCAKQCIEGGFCAVFRSLLPICQALFGHRLG